MAVGGEDAAVFRERSAVREVEGFAVEIGDAAAGFFDDDRACGLVPDFFAVVGARRGEEAEHDVATAGGEDGVLGLAIHADGLFSCAELGCELADFVDVGVGFFYGAEDAGGVGLCCAARR